MNTCQFTALPFLALGIAAIPSVGMSGAGVVIGAYLGFGRIAPLLVGPMADRLGLWTMVCSGLAIRGASLLMVPFAENFQSAMAIAISLGIGVAAYETGIYGVMAAQPERPREKLLMANVQALNLGCMAGPVFGFVAVTISFDLAFIIPALTLIALSAVCVLNRAPEYQFVSHDPIRSNISRVLADGRFLWLCLALIPFWALFAQLFGALPVLMAQASGNDAMASTVIFINGFVGFCAVFLYALLSRRLTPRALAILGCVLGAIATWFLGPWAVSIILVVLIGVFSVAETLVITAADIMTSRCADGKSTGSYFSVLNVSIGVGSAVGAPLGMMAISGDTPMGFALIGMAGVLSAGLLMKSLSGERKI